MKIGRLPSLLVCVCGAASLAPVQAATVGTWDGIPGDSVVTFNQFGTDPPSIQAAAGNPGGFLQITPATNSNNNFATFDRTDAGLYKSSSFFFNFRVDQSGSSADGFGFSYISTTAYGATGGLGGAPPGNMAGEDPAAAGVLGFGFDTWSNNGGTGGFDDPAQPQGSDYEEISLFSNGNLISRINNTRLLAPGITLDDGLWHNAFGTVDFLGATVSLQIDNTTIFSNLAVPGLAPFESRIMFGGRTGGANERAGIDNLDVEWENKIVPEPASAALGLLGVGLIFRRRRR